MSMESIVKETPCGLLEGSQLGGICRYLGIRYATAERFEYPKEVTNWKGIYQAVEYGPAPIQDSCYYPVDSENLDNHYAHEFMRGVHPTYSEDCLYLNIWTPEHAEQAPVLVVLYGGGLVSGMSQSLEFSGEEFARRGIITVTLNYRVNVFGFMYLKELEDEYGRAGNYGYYDQQTAIEWIRHNIGSLGGDIDRMTIIGQSAGAASAETQIKSPLNQGYFKHAIIQSSAGFTTVLKSKDNRKTENEKWSSILETAGVTNAIELKSLPAKKLFDAYKDISSASSIAFCNSVYDEAFTGATKNAPVDTKILYSITSEDVMPLVLHITGSQLAKSQEEKTDTYAYYFCRQLPGDEKGAWHSSDLMYVYGTLDKSWRPFSQEDYNLSGIMIDYLENFIKYGNPNHDGAPVWTPYNQSHKYMNFDCDKCKMKRIPVFHLIKETLARNNIGMN